MECFLAESKKKFILHNLVIYHVEYNMLQTFSRCNIINKDHIIQRIILMEFTASKSFPKQVASIVESFSLCTGIPLDISRQNGISRNCLPPFTMSTIPARCSSSRIVARILQTLQSDVRNCIFVYFQSKLETNLLQLNFLLWETVE